MNDLRYDDRVAVITGAGRGLGRAYALMLAARGAKIVVNDTGGTLTGDGADPTPAQRVAGEIEAAGGVAVAEVPGAIRRPHRVEQGLPASGGPVFGDSVASEGRHASTIC